MAEAKKDKNAAANSNQESSSLLLFEESIKRELKYYRPSPPYHVSVALKKNFINSMKPNTMVDMSHPEIDEEWSALAKKLSQTPREKYEFPQTTGQEYGWDTEDLIPRIDDKRFYHGKGSTDVTRFPCVLKAKAES